MPNWKSLSNLFSPQRTRGANLSHLRSDKMQKKIQIKVLRNLVLKAADGDENACEKVKEAARKPFWDYICSMLFIEGCTNTELLDNVLSNALKCLHDKLKASEPSHWKSHKNDSEFVDEFTEWAKGIADDIAIEELIRALKSGEDWAWKVMCKRVKHRIGWRVPQDDEEDVIQEVLLRLFKAI